MWRQEITPCQERLTAPLSLRDANKGLGFHSEEIYGWRTPRLEWNEALFPVLQEYNLLYDCSVEGDAAEEGRNCYWPHTLHEGSPLDNRIPSIADLWEVPAYPFVVPESLHEKVGKSVVTGLDYDIFGAKEYGCHALSGDEFAQILIYTLEQRIAGNRAPMTVGLHSDVYADMKNGEFPGTLSARERQLGVEKFINYALENYGDIVRFSTTVNLLDWLSNPSPLHAK